MTNPVSGSHTNEGAFVLIVLFFRPHSATKQKNLSIFSGRLCNGIQSFWGRLGTKRTGGIVTCGFSS